MGKDVFETVENWIILILIIGVVMLSIGIGLTIFTPKGLPAILAMMGSLISFLATVALIFTWLVKEVVG
jgi:hypothetical protein